MVIQRSLGLTKYGESFSLLQREKNFLRIKKYLRKYYVSTKNIQFYLIRVVNQFF